MQSQFRAWMNFKCRRVCAWLFALAFMLGLASSASAAPLVLSLDTPIVESAFIDVNYLAGSNALVASGVAQFLSFSGKNLPIASGTFGINAMIDNVGNLVGGTLSIGGTNANIGFGSGTLLTGALTGFWFGGGGGPLEFLFDVTGGDAAGLYGSVGGVRLENTGFKGSFAHDFVNGSFGQTGVPATSVPTSVPEPASIALLGLGLIGLFVVRRRKEKASRFG